MASGDFFSLAKADQISLIHSLPSPKVLLILSGKRKCGKDFLEQQLIKELPGQCASFRISGPIKRHFSRMHSLDFAELTTDSAYKEVYRHRMVEWSEEIRKQDPHIFLREAIYTTVNEEIPVWILNDARRETDIQYFADPSEIDLSTTMVSMIRIECREETRTKRGWTFTAGVDDQTTECGLDHFTDWDHVVQNNGTPEELIDQLAPLIQAIRSKLNL